MVLLSGFSQIHKIDIASNNVNFVLLYICSLLLYLHHMSVNAKIDISQ